MNITYKRDLPGPSSVLVRPGLARLSLLTLREQRALGQQAGVGHAVGAAHVFCKESKLFQLNDQPGRHAPAVQGVDAVGAEVGYGGSPP